MSARVYYAIGDVHGEAEMLAELLGHIEADAVRLGVQPAIVFLGDLIDRGPDSRAVVARVLALEAEGRALCIKGNHEELMLHAYDKDETIGLAYWARNGGDQTIRSYEAINGEKDHWRETIDSEHVKWLRTLPVTRTDSERRIVFVHGGIDPKRFPHCSDEVKLWTRSPAFFRSHAWPDREELQGLLVVHGHTPTDDFEPDEQERRINVDTGACFGGPLTCVVLAPAERPRFLRAVRR